ncbi:MAG: PriCT-2 domain-containing protein [Pleurocapsa sp. MO_226.B13]|nr:PriCT-2 domain-containing protein [Pleurocapsa sp. MO_226.B13]
MTKSQILEQQIALNNSIVPENDLASNSISLIQNDIETPKAVKNTLVSKGHRLHIEDFDDLKRVETVNLKFLRLLHYDLQDTIYARVIGKFPENRSGKLTSLIKGLKDCNENKNQNVYFVVNSGGHKAEDVKVGRALMLEIDKDEQGNLIPIDDQYQIMVDKFGIPTVAVFTENKSLHCYYVYEEPIDPQLWKQMQEDALAYCPIADQSIKDLPRILRLVGFKHSQTGNYSRVYAESGIKYSYEELRSKIPARVVETKKKKPVANAKKASKATKLAAPNTTSEMTSKIEDSHRIIEVGTDKDGLLIVNNIKNHRLIEFDIDDYAGVLSIENLARLLEIKTALEVLDTEICEGYVSWLQIGMALHHEGTTNGNSYFSDAMQELFHVWSQGSDKYEEVKATITWESFGDRDDGIKINTLFHYAHQKVKKVKNLARKIYPLVDSYYMTLKLEPKSTIEETSSDIRNLSTANSPISFVGKAYIDKGIHFDTSDSKETIVRIYNVEEGVWEKQNLISFYADAEYRLNACMKNSYGTIKPLSVKQQKELKAYINVYTKSDPNYIGYKWKSEQSGNIIAFKNKILNLKTKREEDFRKKLYLENKLEREYRPEDGADCPNWIKLISDLTGNDKKVMDVLEAAALLTLTGRGDTERSFITLYSENGGAGKGTFMRTLQGLAGKDRSKTASFDRLSDGNLMTSFENKTLIVFPEERNKLYPNSNAYASLLKLTSKDRIDARGNYQTGIEFQSNAMLFVATNTFLFGNDGGMNRRILQVVCPKKENLIPDRSFGKKLEKELSQITNRLLNKFDFDADNARDLLEEAPDYEAFSNNARIMSNELSNVSQFLEEMVVAVCPIHRDRGLKATEYKTNQKEYQKNPAPFVNITTLYDAFKIYSADVNPGSRIMKKINFIKEVKAHYKLNLGADFTLEEFKESRVQGVAGRKARFSGLIPSEEAKNNELFLHLKNKW